MCLCMCVCIRLVRVNIILHVCANRLHAFECVLEPAHLLMRACVFGGVCVCVVCFVVCVTQRKCVISCQGDNEKELEN